MATSTQQSIKKATSMAELMARPSSKVTTLQKGQIIQGTVKKLTPKEILLDIGKKADALVIEYDKVNLANLLAHLKVGDKVSASVISAESEEGFPVVSLRRMLDDLLFKNLNEVLKNRESIKVRILETASRGGYFAETEDGIKGFLPNSQVLPEAVVSGRTIDAKIIEVDKEKKRVIFSQKATVYTVDPSEIQKYVKKGDTVEAQIHTVTNHGIYAILTPEENIQIEGFLHISEISYERVEDIQKSFKAGQKIKVQVLDIDTENRRVNLSLKRLEKDKFKDAEEKYTKELKVKAKVTDIKSRGVTVELEDGISGFIPASKVPSEAKYSIGEEISAEVSGIDEKRRVVLLTPVMTTKFVGYR